MTTYTVTNTNDSGSGSLRQAILDSNGHPGTNTIIIQIPGGDLKTIAPTSALPTITNPVTIDGTNQPPGVVELTGFNAGPGVNGLTITAGGSTVKGLAINSFSGVGIALLGDGNVLTADLIGTDAFASVGLGNTTGVYVDGSNNMIGVPGDYPDVISGNIADGVDIASGSGNIVQNSYIGTDSSGAFAIPNGGTGVYVGGSGNIVGSVQAFAAPNDIAGNVGDGIAIAGNNNLVNGNNIGTDSTETVSLGNYNGISIAGDNNTVGGNAGQGFNEISGNVNDGVLITGNGNQVQLNFIGLTGDESSPLGNGNGVVISGGSANVITQNLISANTGAGVEIDGNNNQVVSCFIGDSGGNSAFGNGTGVAIVGYGNQVGGQQGSESNLISGNLGDGVSIVGDGNVVDGNNIGNDPTGSFAVPNFNGVEVFGSNNVIGGSADTGNTISGNTNIGVYLSGQGNRLTGNAIGASDDLTQVVPNGYGVYIDGGSSNVIDGPNFIGGNSVAGIYVANSPGNVIAGNPIGAGPTTAFPNGDGIVLAAGSDGTQVTENVISGNLNTGLIINSNGNTVQGNTIGLDLSYTNPMGNEDGILITGSNNVIGGASSASINYIAFNNHDGVLVDGGAGNTIRGDSIYSHNLGLGIELADGGNNGQPFPVITSAVAMTVLDVQGTVAGAPNTTLTLDFFLDHQPNPSGFGEGLEHAYTTTVTTNALGVASFRVFNAFWIPPGMYVSATVTDPNGNTSAFSNCFLVVGADSPDAGINFGSEPVTGMPAAASGPTVLLRSEPAASAILADRPQPDSAGQGGVVAAPAVRDEFFRGLGADAQPRWSGLEFLPDLRRDRWMNWEPGLPQELL